MKIKLEEIGTESDPKGIESAFQPEKQKQVGAIMTITTRLFFFAGRKWYDRRACQQIPVARVSLPEEFVDEGGLMSDGQTSMTSIGAAVHVDKILKRSQWSICRAQQANGI